MTLLGKPSARDTLAILLFFVLVFYSIQLEDPVLHLFIIFLKTHLNLSFHAVYGPRPAVSVNLLSAIVTVRSAFAILLTWLMLKIAGKNWNYAGFSMRSAVRLYGAGSVAALGAMTSLIALMYVSDGLTFDGVRLSGMDRLGYPVRWLVGMVLVGLEEEASSRGFGLIALAQVIGEIPAAVVTSVLFAVAHSGNAGESVLGLSQTFVFAMVCALSVFRTRSIWWAVAFHGVWDWAEECIYGTIGSGSWFDGHLLQLSPRGSHWISGGSTGPEASIYVFLVLGVLLAVEVAWRARPDTERNALRNT